MEKSTAKGTHSTSRATTISLVAFGSIAMLALLTGCDERTQSSQIKPQPTSQSVNYPMSLAGLKPVDAALLRAACAGDISQLTVAIEGGADIRVEDPIGRNAAMVASFCKQPMGIDRLVQSGLSLAEPDNTGIQALHAAAIMGATDVIRALVRNGADINARTERSRTALHLAAATNQPPVVDVLLELGANSQLRDRAGKCPSDLAARNGHAELAKRLACVQK